MDEAGNRRRGTPPAQARRVADIDWSAWSAVDPATLAFVIRGGRILLIRKKRGLGAGKVNGPGGRIEPGETPAAGAARELQEELGIRPVDLVRVGDHRFQFVDGYSTYVHVYRASDLRGTPVETDEAVPLWVDLDAIPFDEMWEDDRLWLPLVLEGRRFSGYWIFDGDRMLDYRLDVQGAHGAPRRERRGAKGSPQADAGGSGHSPV